jgi:hypothetical protein
MIPEVIRKYTVPRWLYTSVVVPSGEEIRVDPDAFANNTKYRMHLIAMSFGAPNETPYTQVPAQPNEHPAWNHMLLIDIGKSGCSDMNLVSGTLTALCGNMRYVRSFTGDSNMGRNWRLPTPYLLPRDEGLRVSVEWIRPQYSISGRGIGPATSGEVTFLAKGYKPDGYPAMLAGRVREFDSNNRGNAQLMNSADLFNNGKTEMYLTELLYKEHDLYYDNNSARWFMTGHSFNFAWQVNPTNPTFTQFMPQPRHIPTGLLAPMCRTLDGGSESPLVYFFPKGTFLDPKQAIGVKCASTADHDNIPLHICLIGELEVK